GFVFARTGLAGVLLLLRLVKGLFGAILAQIDRLEPVLAEDLGDVQGGLLGTSLTLHRPTPPAPGAPDGERILAPPPRVVSVTRAGARSGASDQSSVISHQLSVIS